MIPNIVESVVGVAALVAAYFVKTGADKSVRPWVLRIALVAVGGSLLILGLRSLLNAH
jgi:uncharacterized membrane-anchored protein